MADAIKEFFKHMYPWHIHAMGAVVILGMMAFIWYTYFGVHRVSKAFSAILKHDDNIQTLWKQIDELKSVNEFNKTVAEYVSRAIYEIKPFIDALNDLRLNSGPRERLTGSSILIQRLVDSLTTDIKMKSGEHHRCCIWGADGPDLRPLVTSSGFPNNYNVSRELHRDNSIAGRAFRTKQTQNIPDVTLDREWSRNPDSRSTYKSLICIPIGDVAVLTIDGNEPMRIECQHIGELFAAVIEGAINEYYKAMTDIESAEYESFLDEQDDIG